MKYYTTTTEFNCGIDLHSRQMYICVMDRLGNKLVHCNIKGNDFDYFLKKVAPYRHDQRWTPKFGPAAKLRLAYGSLVV